MAEYNAMELMICAAARLLENRCTVSVGTGAPCAASMLAQKTHAPDMTIFFEAGGIAPILPEMPISVGDSRTSYQGIMASGMCDIMETCQRGLVDYTFLGGAQIDPYGNLNSTVIGDHKAPKVRFPGSGGANDFASFCWRSITARPFEVGFTPSSSNTRNSSAFFANTRSPSTRRTVAVSRPAHSEVSNGRLRSSVTRLGTAASMRSDQTTRPSSPATLASRRPPTFAPSLAALTLTLAPREA